MATVTPKTPKAIELWRAEAANCYRAYLALQALAPVEFEARNGAAWEARMKHDDERIMRLLLDTGDSACLACAARYEAAKAEK